MTRLQESLTTTSIDRALRPETEQVSGRFRLEGGMSCNCAQRRVLIREGLKAAKAGNVAQVRQVASGVAASAGQDLVELARRAREAFNRPARKT